MKLHAIVMAMPRQVVKMTKLEQMLKYVSEHNDFYKKRIKEYGISNPLDITQWPVLTREELQENRYNMFSEGYKSKYFNQQLRRQSSSGSSGIPVNVYWDYKDWYASNMSLWRKRWEWYKIKPSDRCVRFSLNSFNIKYNDENVYYSNEYSNILSFNISLVQDDNRYNNIIDLINEFDPKWIQIQPFILNKLIQTYKKFNRSIPKSLMYVESVGEILPSDLRRRTTEFFGKPLANLYGSEEMNGIAYENQNQCMHILSDNVYIEVMKKEGIDYFGKGESIITNLNNFAMPLIRYNQKDQLSIKMLPEQEQLYPLTNIPIVELISGRSYESIIIFEQEISQLLLVDIISEVNNVFYDCITAFYYVFYKSKNTLECRIATDKKHFPLFPNLKNAIENCFFEKVFSNNALFNFIVIMDTKKQSKHTKNCIIEIVE